MTVTPPMSVPEVQRISLFSLLGYVEKDLSPAPPDDPLRAEAIQLLQAEFTVLLSRDAALKGLIDRLLKADCQAVVFGGWVRDLILGRSRGEAVASRDIDMVTHGPKPLAELMPPSVRRSIFGGFCMEASTTQLDIWELQHTYLIVERQLPVRFETLPRTTVFRCNSLIFRPAEFFGTPDIMEAGALRAIQERVVDFQAREVPLPQVQASRAVIYAAKLGFRLAPEVADFIADLCRLQSNLEMIEAGVRTYCPSRHAAAAQRLLRSLCRECPQSEE